MSDPDVESQGHNSSDDGRRTVQDEQSSNAKEVSENVEAGSIGPADHEKSTGSDDSVDESPKPDNRPRHAKTGKPLSLLREIVVVTVVCLAQLMTQAGVGQGRNLPSPLTETSLTN